MMFSEAHPLLIADPYDALMEQTLRAWQVPYVYAPQSTAAEAAALLQQAGGLVLRSKLKLDAELLSHAPHLKVVIRTGAGIEHIDSEVLAQRGIALHTTAGANSAAVGEHALAMLLALANNLYRAHREVSVRIWRRWPNMGTEIGGSTVGIVGYGHTGRAFAQKVSGLGVTTLAYDKYRSNYSDQWAQQAELDTLLQQADVLSLHVPLTAETHHMVNDAFLARCANPIFFLNLSRGPVVDTAALIRALQQGRIRAAGLDVLENEHMDSLTPPQAAQLSQLAAMDQVLLSPHIGGWSVQTEQRFVAHTLEILRHYV